MSLITKKKCICLIKNMAAKELPQKSWALLHHEALVQLLGSGAHRDIASRGGSMSLLRAVGGSMSLLKWRWQDVYGPQLSPRSWKFVWYSAIFSSNKMDATQIKWFPCSQSSKARSRRCPAMSLTIHFIFWWPTLQRPCCVSLSDFWKLNLRLLKLLLVAPGITAGVETSLGWMISTRWAQVAQGSLQPDSSQP